MSKTNNEEKKPIFFSGIMALVFIALLIYLGLNGTFGGSITEIIATVLFTKTVFNLVQFIGAGLIIMGIYLSLLFIIEIIVATYSLFTSQTFKSFKTITDDEEKFVLEKAKAEMSSGNTKPETKAKIDEISTIEELKMALIWRRVFLRNKPEFYFMLIFLITGIIVYILAGI